MSALLAIDQGGHATRAVIFDAMGRKLAAHEVPIATVTPKPDYVEHTAGEMLASVGAAIEGALAQSGIDTADIAAAGLATQRSSIACWDRVSGQPLSPIISWQDRRQWQWLQDLDIDAHQLHARTGLRLSPHYGASKLRWCLDHLPAVREAAANDRLCCGPLASFLLYHLLEQRPCLADPANASRTLLWNLRDMNWDDALLQLFDISRAILPRCVPSRHDYGELMLAGRPVPLTLATGDQSAALFAWGMPAMDTLYINIGTGAFLQLPRATAENGDDRLLNGIAFHDGTRRCYTLEGTVNGAARALNWLAQRHGIPHIERQLPVWLANVAEPPLFLNGIAGLGSPDWVPRLESCFIGTGTGPEQAVAVIESIVFLIQRNIEAMRDRGHVPRHIIVSGGLARLDDLCQRLANLSQLTVMRPDDHEATARGTAFLTGGASSQWHRPGFRQFLPLANDALRSRWLRWTDHLERAIALSN